MSAAWNLGVRACAAAWPLRRAKITIKGAWVGRRRVCDLSALQRAPASGDVRRDAWRGWQHTTLRKNNTRICHDSHKKVSAIVKITGGLAGAHRERSSASPAGEHMVPQINARTHSKILFFKIYETNDVCILLVLLWCLSQVNFSPEVEKQAPQ
jgi:hypothetical protein